MHINKNILIGLSVSVLLGWNGAFADPGSTTEPKDNEPLPTLDELLGLDSKNQNGDNTSKVVDAKVVDANDAALEQVLSPKQAGEAFSQAVSLMDQVAARISEHNDLSITTQRLQQDILTKLDQVIESAQKNDSNNSGSSSSSSSSSTNESQPNQQQSQQPGEGSQPGGEPGDSPMPGGNSNAQPGDEVMPDGVSWGSLPKRIRDALSQGITDQYSELYRSITEQYYKSLAEDQD